MNTVRDLGVAVIVLGVVLVLLTTFAVVAIIRENVTLLRVVSVLIGRRHDRKV
jgi:hypothetical protein